MSHLLYMIFLLLSGHTTLSHSPVSKDMDPLLIAASVQMDTQRVVALHFDEPHIDLGKVRKGEKVSGSFSFINAGTEPIEIELVSACECTTLDWPVQPVPPGARSSIDFVFDSSQKEASETIEVDIHLKNTDPKTGYPVLEIVSYRYELVD